MYVRAERKGKKKVLGFIVTWVLTMPESLKKKDVSRKKQNPRRRAAGGLGFLCGLLRCVVSARIQNIFFQRAFERN